MAKKRAALSFRLSAIAADLLAKLAERAGISKTGILEMLIRQEARKQGVRPDPEGRNETR
jgi:hypothetical protein